MPKAGYLSLPDLPYQKSAKDFCARALNNQGQNLRAVLKLAMTWENPFPFMGAYNQKPAFCSAFAICESQEVLSRDSMMRQSSRKTIIRHLKWGNSIDGKHRALFYGMVSQPEEHPDNAEYETNVTKIIGRMHKTGLCWRRAGKERRIGGKNYPKNGRFCCSCTNDVVKLNS